MGLSREVGGAEAGDHRQHAPVPSSPAGRSSIYAARIDGGTKQITELDLTKKGKYALLCFVSDRKGGPPQVAQGMVGEITVR